MSEYVIHKKQSYDHSLRNAICWRSETAKPFCCEGGNGFALSWVEYEVEHLDPLKIRSMSPTGKVPWIRMGKSTLSESDSIITFLNSKQDVDLFDGLTNDQKVLGLALKRLTEDHLYWLMVWARWISNTPRLALT